jgi:site-specific recombinase XerD
MPTSWQTEFKLMYWFRIARTKSDMPWLHFHDCRHSSASAMIQDGVDLHTVGAVLGHRSSVSTRRYAHLATDNLKAAIGKIGTKAKNPPSTFANAIK